MPVPVLAMPKTLLPAAITRHLDVAAAALLQPPGGRSVDFSMPAGEPALVRPDSVSWRVFKNPVALFIGGVAAVILELAEPGVRTGVWEHSSFRTDPLARLQRTGLAAMITVYAARSVAEAMIGDIVRVHGGVSGTTPSGAAYSANDPALLTWVQATASYGFAEAYSRYVRPLSSAELDRYYGEGEAAARLYGAVDAPLSETARAALFESMRGRLEPSSIVFEFLGIMQTAPIFPAPLRRSQRLLVRAAVELTPPWVREVLGLDASHGLRPWQGALVTQAARFSDRVMLNSSPAIQSCLRLGLPADYLYP